ncbi:M55 family metallopeptidase [Dehalococcoidia bacterium]|nr:M55 family metallopeptidase [Dehalococcoidia bacterium]MCL0090546.1 M55 family metallopeptidase [Dehalococcoidia bacterium]
MNVLISVDMEGISGVVAAGHTSLSHKEYERFRKLMTADANAAIEGALSGGVTQVVTDGHYGRRASATQCRGTGGAGGAGS